MKNKLKTKPVNNQRYLKGLSLAEQDDVEQAVEYALEDPGGTFTRVSQEHSAKLSAMNKTVKSISGDTKYIRKAVDKFDKKLDALQQAFEDGGGGGAGGIGDAFPWRTGASPARAAGASRLGSLLKGAGGLLLLGGALYAIDESAPSIISKIDKMRPDNSKPMTKIETGWGKGLIGTDIAGAAGQATREWVIKKYKDMFGNTTSPAKQKNSISNRISYQQNNFFQQAQGNNTRGIPELTPSERAIIIRDRLKGMTQIPSMQGGGFAGNHMQMPGIPNARGSLGGGYGRGRPSDTGYPDLPSVTVSDGGIGGTRDGGRGQRPANSNIGVKPGTGTIKGRPALMKMVYDGYRSAGFSDNQARALTAEVGRENDFNPGVLFGTHTDPHNGAKNLGMLSMQGSRGTGLYDHLASKGLIGADGKMIPGQASINAMAAYTKKEMETDPAYAKTKKQFLENPNVDPEAAAGVLGRNYIRWRMDDPRYASHNTKRQGHLAEISNITQDGQFKQDIQVAHGASAITTATKKETQVAGIDLAGPIPKTLEEAKNSGDKVGFNRMKGDPRQFLSQEGNLVPIKTPYGEAHVTKDSALAYQGYFNELHAAGAPIKTLGSQNLRRKQSAGHGHNPGGGWSQHSWGNSIDLDNRTDLSPAMRRWMAENPRVLEKLDSKWGMLTPSGDEPHKEYSGAVSKEAQDQIKTQIALLQTKQKETAIASAVPKAVMPPATMALADTSAYGKWRAEKDKGAQSVARAKSYALYDDIKNPERKFPGAPSVADSSATPNRDAHFAKIDAAIAKKKAEKKLAAATLPLTPGAEGKGDFDRRTGQERLAADRSTDGLLERANAYALNQDKYPQPERIFPNARPQPSIPQQVTRPMAAQVVPEPDGGGLLKTARDMAQAAIDKAKEATTMVTDYIQGAKEVVPQTVNRIPKTSKNPPPLTNPPRTYHRATQTTNPTAKTPGSDSSKSFGTTTESEAAWQYPAIEMGVP